MQAIYYKYLATEGNPGGEMDLSDPGKRKIAEKVPNAAGSQQTWATAISRRRLLGHVGKALYLAPTLTVLGIVPKVAVGANSDILCPPNVPNNPNCPDTGATTSRSDSYGRQPKKPTRRSGGG